ncbi:MAG: hypothetical protein H7263_07120 [Candidatus Sericytochromatia bacterium]|nr:hypothetical protein [Candidatus Sericytochromatia bacterium]
MLKLFFTTSGKMTLEFEGLILGNHDKEPIFNAKSYITAPNKIILEAEDMKKFTDWGCIELLPVKDAKDKVIAITIGSDVWGWYGTAQIALEKDGQVVFNDNFQSGVKGPIGNANRFRTYPVLNV